MFEIKIDIPKVEAEIKAAFDAVDKSVESGLMNTAKGAQGVAEQKVEAIEKSPIPSRSQVNAFNAKGGRRRTSRAASNAPAWERTGELASDVKQPPVFENKNEVSFSFDAEHANRRHGLGVDWQPKAPALGVVRKNSFFEETERDISADEAAQMFAEGFESTFSK
jgi:hypothetical protein